MCKICRRDSLRAIIIFLLPLSLFAELCPSWSKLETLGSLNRKFIFESSGITSSRVFADRLYHINDSGDGSHFYITDLEGRSSQKILIEDFYAKDFEDMDSGPCLENSECLYIGDIGDNAVMRPFINIAVVEEEKNFPAKIKALKILQAKYPDGSHNAEALAVHPNGDLYIFTKEKLFFLGTAPSYIYRIKKEDLDHKSHVTMDYIGQIDVPSILSAHSAKGQLVTGMDIHPNGKKFLLLTYDLVLEFDLDLSLGVIPSKSSLNYKKIVVKKLKQQEAISYLQNEDSFIYTTESKKVDSPILKSACKP